MASIKSPFSGLTGKGVRVAVIDSGVHASHPHITGVAGGITIGPAGDELGYVDRIGHGTAVMAAIQEKAPDAEYFAIRVFHSSLRTTIDVLVSALEWSLANRMDIVNLSLGTTNPAHRERFAPLIEQANTQHLTLVSACHAEGTPAFPGSMPGVIGVDLDWECPRDSVYVKYIPEGRIVCASGYPRSFPGVPKERNLRGISFAVANVTGCLARAFQALGSGPTDALWAALENETASTPLTPFHPAE